ncbi:yeats family protein [Coniochaeta ligniaria NRRL 30616]|uniref:Protein AF-9 homolog n=1 Tax=Coniochaeta ligniaria NRRL 30616 TaxID=1408157 RepID=A0A1J7K0F7_9PEZI|nr:yeats family protein [Coniochaeta ligniaria NRRL 30616]
MAPPSGAGKRVKGIQIARPFIYGTTARPFDPKTNPKPAGVPDDHTHSWTVFVKGIDDTDITYWLRRVQFKLHESIPNHVRMVEAPEPGKPFEVHETGWGEFEITIKLYYATESSEKPQTLYHFLKLHPFARNEEEKEALARNGNGEVISWTYEEQLFNEPFEPEGGVLERSAMIPLANRPGQPFSRETELLEIKKLRDAQAKIQDMVEKLQVELKEKEERLRVMRAEAVAAGGKA